MTVIESISAPAVLPVSISELHDWIQRDPAEIVDDRKYTQAIAGATDMFEQVTNMRLVSQSHRWKPWRFGDQNYSACQGRKMKIPYGNTSGVSIEYIDSEGVTQPFTDFTIQAFERFNFLIVLNRDAEWPTDIDYTTQYPISIDFDCGYPVGEVWSVKPYVAGDTMRPTYERAFWMAYKATAPGTPTEPEKALTTTTGATTSDGALVWECLGKTFPDVAMTSILAMATHLIEKGFVYLDPQPNMNEMVPNWQRGVNNCMLQW